MLKELNDIDIVVTSIFEREQSAANAVDNRTAWIKSYGLIERALETFLLNYNRVPESIDGRRKDHHRRILEAFDDETLPLHEALGAKVQPGRLPLIPAARRYIDALRRLRNAENHPESGNSSTRASLGRLGDRIGYRAWYTTVFEGLVQCLKISVEFEKVKRYCRKVLRYFRCDSGTNCGRDFKTYAEWKVHALREHPDVFKISGIADKASSSQAPAIPAKAAFDVASAYLSEALRMANLAAQYLSDTAEASNPPQSTSQSVAHPGSVITQATGHPSAGVSSSESDTSRDPAVERRSDTNKPISDKSQAVRSVLDKVSYRDRETIIASRTDTAVSGFQDLDIPSSQSALKTMVSEHQIALQRIADLELANARLKEDVAYGKLRDASNDRALEQRDKTISEYLELLKIQESELEEAAKGKREGFKEGKAAGEKEVWEKIDRCR